MDEISVAGKTYVAWLREGTITEHEYSPKDLGVPSYPAETMIVSSLDESAEAAVKILDGTEASSGRRDLVLVNAAAAIVVSGMASDFPDALSAARRSLESGAAYRKLEGLIRFSGGELRRS
jgi:anthranilate phosphoribosyltransferase